MPFGGNDGGLETKINQNSNKKYSRMKHNRGYLQLWS